VGSSLLIALLLTGITGLTAEQRSSTRSAQASRKPNVVFILGDDLGYCDISMYGCKEIPTPNIDSIGRNGVKFTNAYVTAPVCSPSRAALITGRYQQRFGFEFNAGPLPRAISNKDMGLPLTGSPWRRR
jgi:arylsulfatase A-like enzyme